MHKPGQRDERASSLAGLGCQGEHPAGDFAPKFHAAHLPLHRQGPDTLSDPQWGLVAMVTKQRGRHPPELLIACHARSIRSTARMSNPFLVPVTFTRIPSRCLYRLRISSRHSPPSGMRKMGKVPFSSKMPTRSIAWADASFTSYAVTVAVQVASITRFANPDRGRASSAR